MALSQRFTPYLLCLLLVPCSIARGGPAEAARAAIDRTCQRTVDRLVLETISPQGGRDAYDYVALDGTLTVRGNTAVAICRGFYDYLRANGLSMVSWSGTRAAIPDRWPDAPLTMGGTPYEHRFYLNVVTYGYSMPYWTWDRWERELDWMAFHGVNLPLAMVGTEAIGYRVWQRLGLTRNEIDPFYTGPAHLPWQRMGNIAGLDGPLPPSWNDDQVALQHKILARMRELGIEPIAPAFAGFVPAAFQAHYPSAQLHELGWAGFPPTKFLPPDDPLFQKIGAMYIQEWEKEFGKARYFLSDSFNEMQLPQTARPVTDLLAEYGDCIYRSLHAGDADAVWVLQGWMFGYQRDIWNPQTVKALLSKVPADRMLILDEACDYNGEFWHNGMNWKLFDGFDGKPWVYGVIPNMGGKTAWTGVLDFYASDSTRALNSTSKGNLVGIGFAPEGIENNDVIYELMSDMAWRTSPINLDDWIRNYCTNRYGACPEKMAEAWKKFSKTAYGTFTLGQAAIYMATAPKSNASALGIWAAMKDVREGRTLPVPKHLKDGHYAGSKRLGHGQGYKYAHDFAGGFVEQDYLGVPIIYYKPTDRGFEAELRCRLEWRIKEPRSPEEAADNGPADSGAERDSGTE
jgi:alpha-N-acetylglucosaminidase